MIHSLVRKSLNLATGPGACLWSSGSKQESVQYYHAHVYCLAASRLISG